MNKILIFFIFIFLTACSSPEGLVGKWEVDSQKCLLKDKSSIFTDKIAKDRKYTLEFKAENQVHLIYPDVDIPSGSDAEKCDVIFIGKYSSTLLGNIQFDFKNDDTGAYQTAKGANCDTDLILKVKGMPKASIYKDDPAVSLEKLDEKELQLGFSDFDKCKDEKMTITFNKK